MLRRNTIILLSIVVFCLAFVMILYAFSRQGFSHLQDFNRTHRNNFVEEQSTLDLRNYSYYIAGATTEHIFFGNRKDPFDLLMTSSTLSEPRHIRLSLVNGDNTNLIDSHIEIDSPFFYIKAGNLACVFRGTVGHWEASPIADSLTFFTQAIPITTSSLVFIPGTRINAGTQNVLQKNPGTRKVKLDSQLPEQDSNRLNITGMLRYCKNLNRIVYVYFYRDEFVVLDSSLNLMYRSSTTDATGQSHIKPMEIMNPEIVNLGAEVYNNLLFIKSSLVAKNETQLTTQDVSVIDVYDIQSNTYRFSFYIPDYQKIKMSSFKVMNDRILALYDHYVVTYAFKDFPLQSLNYTTR